MSTNVFMENPPEFLSILMINKYKACNNKTTEEVLDNATTEALKEEIYIK